jgi:ubiquinone biosynthesis O-methyltransferase
MNTIRMQYIVDQLMKEQPGKDQHHRHLPLHGLKALDVGCGGGILSESLARLGAQTTGLDPSTKLVEQARLHSSLDPRTRSIEYKGGLTVEEFANENTHGGNEKYDIVCLLEVLEHVTDIESILGACKQLLKPATGRLFVSTLNRTLKSHLVAIVGAEYLAGYLPVGTHNWNQFLSPREVHNLMTQCELSQLDVQGMVVTRLPPLPGIGGEWSWKLDQSDLDVNWIGTYKICEDADIDRNRSHTQ